MNSLLTHPLARLAAALLAWAGLAAFGWWWHKPTPWAEPTGTTAPAPAGPAVRDGANSDAESLAARLQAQDPFALQRTAPPALPGAAAASAPGSDDIVWRFAALTENRGERHVLLTATEQPPLVLKVGDKLPNGELIKSIDATSVLLQDTQGRKRTLHLIEP